MTDSPLADAVASGDLIARVGEGAAPAAPTTCCGCGHALDAGARYLCQPCRAVSQSIAALVAALTEPIRAARLAAEAGFDRARSLNWSRYDAVAVREAGDRQAAGRDRRPGRRAGEGAALDPALRLRWREDGSSAAVFAADQRTCLGFVYRVWRWGGEGWANTADDAVMATAVLAANLLAGCVQRSREV